MTPDARLYAALTGRAPTEPAADLATLVATLTEAVRETNRAVEDAVAGLDALRAELPGPARQRLLQLLTRLDAALARQEAAVAALGRYLTAARR